MSLRNRIKQRISGINFFQIYFENKIGNSNGHFLSTEELKQVDKDKIIRERNNDSILTPNNWNDHKETFFNQRMELHKSSYTIDEKINLDLDNIELIDISKTDHKILKERYKAFLLNRLEQPQQNEYDWFVVGKLFATGEMSGLLEQFNSNATRIARHLKRDNLRPCISDSIGASLVAQKNLFNSRKKMMSIIDHCNNQKIVVQSSFSDRLPPE
jgi:hypothetical protein